jgi:tryptophanase
VALCLTAGIRAVEIGSVMFGKPGPDGRELPVPMELVRLTFPRRVYTQSHVDYVAEALQYVQTAASTIPGLRITHQRPALRHFTARFELLASAVSIARA